MSSPQPSAALDVYQRAWGRSVAKLAEDACLPVDLLGIDPWWLPDPNPFPRFTFLTWRRRRQVSSTRYEQETQ